ncbi:MAG TPA: lytic transglycosylase domain-containing protein [Xanthobacteraceae bacterium]|nr:lytic transglycosylase domain-containing protein [Xanthobacteraceae bacterium]
MRFSLALCGLSVVCGVAAAEPAAQPAATPPAAAPAATPPAAAPAATESVHEALCRMIETASRQHGVAADFLVNLIWRESSFRDRAVSPAGAQGIAQFMPGTAARRGLNDPFDPEKAIPEAARLIADLAARFGNLGLAAAAYNAGPGRVEKWLAKEASLPAETRTFVMRVTGRSADDWAAQGASGANAPLSAPARSCTTIVAALRRAPLPTREPEPDVEAPFAPWGVQLAGNFSKDRALAAFNQQRARYAGVIGDVRPMVIGTRLRSRGTSTFYRVRVPAASRGAADALCNRIRATGGACVVLRS